MQTFGAHIKALRLKCTNKKWRFAAITLITGLLIVFLRSFYTSPDGEYEVPAGLIGGIYLFEEGEVFAIDSNNGFRDKIGEYFKSNGSWTLRRIDSDDFVYIKPTLTCLHLTSPDGAEIADVSDERIDRAWIHAGGRLKHSLSSWWNRILLAD
jgi:hypothetical protein